RLLAFGFRLGPLGLRLRRTAEAAVSTWASRKKKPASYEAGPDFALRDGRMRPSLCDYTRPWSSMALATFRNPPMLAPFPRLPGVPYFSAVSKQFRWMAIMILCRRSSTSSRVQLSRALFWAISRPDVATPPALAALAGPYRILASRNILVASSVDGMFAPSATSLTPFLIRFAASFAVISFCVALGNAQSAFTFQSGLCSSLISVGMKIAFLNLSA